MSEPVSISIIVPVYEDNDDNVIINIYTLVNKLNELGIKEYELLVFLSIKRYLTFPDYLTNNKKIIFVDHRGEIGLGSIFRKGIQRAGKEYVGILPPYNQINLESLKDICAALKGRDMVVAYIKNPKARSWHRIVASAVNTMMVNLLFGLKLKYYHLSFFRTSLAKKVNITSDSHAAMIETTVWLAKSGASVIQLPFIMVPHDFKSKSRAFRIANIVEIFKTYATLFWQVQILRKRLF